MEIECPVNLKPSVTNVGQIDLITQTTLLYCFCAVN